LLNQFYPPDTAATGQLLADVAKALAAAGHEVHVVCSWGLYGGGHVADGGASPGPAGVHVRRVGTSGLGRRTRLRNRFYDWGAFYLLAASESLRLGRLDACLVLTSPPFISAVGARVKRLWGTRLVLWMMDLWPDVAEAVGSIPPGGLISRSSRILARWTHARADVIISLGVTMTERLCNQGVPRDKITTVHNWVPSEAVTPLPWGRTYHPSCAPFEGRFVVM
jgi:hypothetical protein